jgi:pimeloyl-ACP methyl ester carboxylesterase
MPSQSAQSLVYEIRHGHAPVRDGELHYFQLGEQGSPILLVHGFPETSRVFERLMPHLAASHRVFAVDLRGFGQSSKAQPGHDSARAAEDLHAFIKHLGLDPVHLLAQDISGTIAFRLAAGHPELFRSVAAIETGLPGFGLEMLADVGKGGAWYIGVLATEGAAEAFFRGRERALVLDFILPAATARMDSIPTGTLDAIVADYARPGGWSGARALYASMLLEGPEIQSLAAERPLTLPVLAIDRQGSDFTLKSFGAAHAGVVRHATIDDVGHYIALEAPDRLADILLSFTATVEAALSDRARESGDLCATERRRYSPQEIAE